MGKLSERIRDLILRQVREHGLVVWYDPERVYTRLAQAMASPELTVLAYVDGFFRLRQALEPHLEFVTDAGKVRDGAGAPPAVVIHVPMDRAQTSFALVEAETAGVVVEPGAGAPERNSRLSVLAEEFFREVAPEKSAQLARQAAEGLLTLEELDRIAEEVGRVASGALQLIFDGRSPLDLILEFAAGPEKDAKLVEKDALGELRELVRSELGLDPGAASPAEARQALRRLILLGEFAAAWPEAGRPQPLRTVPLPDRSVQTDNLRRLCTAWRNRSDLRGRYVEAAIELDRIAGVGQMGLDPEAVETVETFPSVDHLLVQAAERALLDGRLSDALRLAQRRRSSFWSREQPPLGLRWAALEHAAHFLTLSSQIREDLKRLNRSAAEMVKAYTQHAEPWMMADRLHRHWESRLVTLDPEEAGGGGDFERLAARVRREHMELTDELNRAFVREFERSGFTAAGILTQNQIFAQRVAPILRSGRPAVLFMVDALRYEMGVELLDGLEPDFEIAVEPALACLPTLTTVGMAALLPGAEQGLSMKTAGARLVVEIGGQSLRNREARMNVLAGQVPAGAAVLRLADVIRLGPRRKQELAKSPFIVVTSQEIDRLAEGGDDQADTRRWMDEVLEQLRRAIRILARLGAECFVIAADHGFIYSDELDPGMWMDPPGGVAVELHPRVWIGRGGQDAPGYLRVPGSRLQAEGGLEFAFPRGYACFRLRGCGGGYFHGGISLQEMVIPLAVLERKAGAPAGVGGIQVELQFDRPAITNRFFSVTACLRTKDLLAVEEVRVRAVVLAGTVEAGTCAMAAYGFAEGAREIVLRLDQPNALTFMLTAEPAPAKVTVRLVDCQTQLEVASRKDIPVQLGI